MATYRKIKRAVKEKLAHIVRSFENPDLDIATWPEGFDLEDPANAARFKRAIEEVAYELLGVPKNERG